jgi:hypothetical protein
VAGSELLVDDIIRGDAPYFVAQAIGQDFVTLTVALPSLVVAAILAGRGSGGGRLIWLGVLTYLVYTYAIYAFATRFNSLFLVYVALLGCSLYEMLPAGASGPWKRAKGRGRHNLGRIVSRDRRIYYSWPRSCSKGLGGTPKPFEMVESAISVNLQ